MENFAVNFPCPSSALNDTAEWMPSALVLQGKNQAAHKSRSAAPISHSAKQTKFCSSGGGAPLSMVLLQNMRRHPFPDRKNAAISVVCSCPLNILSNCITASFTFIKKYGHNPCLHKENPWNIALTIAMAGQAVISPVAEVKYL